MPTPFPPSLIDTAYTWLCARREDYDGAAVYGAGASAEEVAAYERRWFGWVRGGLGGVLEEE